MGYIRHEVVVAIVGDYSDEDKLIPAEIEKLKADWPKGLPDCILGPTSGVNGTVTWVFAPDGSKEGWDTSDDGDRMRERFVEIMHSAKYPCIVRLQMGGDDGETRVLSTTDRSDE